MFVYLTGARASEVVRLKYSDICFEDRVISLTTFKGSGAKRTRTIPMSQALEDLIQNVKKRAQREFRFSKDAQVFVNVSGQPVTSTSDTSFERSVFATAAECQQAQQNTPWFNCTQNVSFNNDGTASMLVTDIMNVGMYLLLFFYGLNRVFPHLREVEVRS